MIQVVGVLSESGKGGYREYWAVGLVWLVRLGGSGHGQEHGHHALSLPSERKGGWGVVGLSTGL